MPHHEFKYEIRVMVIIISYKGTAENFIIPDDRRNKSLNQETLKIAVPKKYYDWWEYDHY